MHSTYKLAALAALVSATFAIDMGVPGPWGPNDPLINIYNTSPADICYKVEFSSGNFPTTTVCDSSPGVLAKASQSVSIHPGANFNGALTAILTGEVKGARHEINFSGGSTCFYDVDYQLGMSNSTLGPADHRPRMGTSLSAMNGEQDTLAKANAAWPHTPNQAILLQNQRYLRQGPDGKLNHVYMDADAPEIVAQFFQITAEFTAYVGAGSVAGYVVAAGTVQSEMVKAADEKSWEVDTLQMEILAC